MIDDDFLRVEANVGGRHGAGGARACRVRLNLRDIAARLVIASGKKKGQHPSPATVMRMLREHDQKTSPASVVA